MKRCADQDFDDGNLALDDEAQVEAFLRRVERNDHKRRKIPWRRMERRLERRMLASGRYACDKSDH